jgi:hypothetical protein
MRNKIIRVYPVRTSRDKWNIKLFKTHKCTELCDINLETNGNELIITNNPNFRDGKCDK